MKMTENQDLEFRAKEVILNNRFFRILFLFSNEQNVRDL